jgi:hypothetical protein
MNRMIVLGLVLVILGLVGLIAGDLTYTKDRDKADIGPVNITVERKEHVHIPPALAVAVLAGGALLIVAGNRRRPA